MANSKLRRSARKREPPHKFEPAEAPSPTRPTKRRKANAPGAVAPLVDPEPELEIEDHLLGNDEEEDEEEDEGTTEMQLLTEDANRMVPYLYECAEPINAQKQYPNQDEHVVKAYAKIAGRTWTYYALQPVITIGRQADKRASQAAEATEGVVEDALPDIDLGPGKHVSREHAEIRYTAEDENWHLFVRGRNGAKVNGHLIRKGQQTMLKSGDVLEIADTEMIFICVGVKAEVQESFLQRLGGPPHRIKQEASNQQYAQWPEQMHAHPTGLHTGQAYPVPTHISPYGPPVAVEGQASSADARPSTPPGLLLQFPYLAQGAQPAKAAAALAADNQPVTLETNERIDYSSNANKDVKPPMSYATLIAQAILAGPNEKQSLNGIYEWIKKHFAYYRHIDPSWQNSIRHNLSLNAAFQKVARESHEPGKGGMWLIVDEKREEFKRNGWKMTSRGGARASSNPSSPAPNKNKSPKRRTPPRIMAGTGQSDQTPPAPSFSYSSQASQTPLRQTTNAISIPKINPTPQIIDDNSPLPYHRSYLHDNANTAGSPPMLSSGALLEEPGTSSGTYANPFTPAPRRQEINYNAPSTAKLPSQYLLQSSPAPFWRGLDMTPTQFPQTSPIKADVKGPPEVPTSSSPPRDDAHTSPLRARTRPELGLGIQQTEHVEKDQPESGQLDLMGSFPKIGDNRPVNPAH